MGLFLSPSISLTLFSYDHSASSKFGLPEKSYDGEHIEHEDDTSDITKIPTIKGV